MEIKDYHGYKVTDTGVVFGKYGQRRTPSLNGSGQPTVSLYIEGCSRPYLVHRLVAELFITNDDPKNKTIVTHIDKNPLNNAASNLCWTTRSKCCGHSEGNRAASKAVMKIDDKGEIVKEYSSQSAAAKDNGVSTINISNYVRGKQIDPKGYTWKLRDE